MQVIDRRQNLCFAHISDNPLKTGIKKFRAILVRGLNMRRTSDRRPAANTGRRIASHLTERKFMLFQHKRQTIKNWPKSDSGSISEQKLNV